MSLDYPQASGALIWPPLGSHQPWLEPARQLALYQLSPCKKLPTLAAAEIGI